MSDEKCPIFETLAHNSVAHVQACTCAHGTIGVLVHVGPVTLRIDEVAFEQLGSALESAKKELRRRREKSPMVNALGGGLG